MLPKLSVTFSKFVVDAELMTGENEWDGKNREA
jgi:hypothetical protein